MAYLKLQDKSQQVRLLYRNVLSENCPMSPLQFAHRAAGRVPQDETNTQQVCRNSEGRFIRP